MCQHLKMITLPEIKMGEMGIRAMWQVVHLSVHQPDSHGEPFEDEKLPDLEIDVAGTQTVRAVKVVEIECLPAAGLLLDFNSDVDARVD